jgi:hypothetical protein
LVVRSCGAGLPVEAQPAVSISGKLELVQADVWWGVVLVGKDLNDGVAGS